MKNSN